MKTRSRSSRTRLLGVVLSAAAWLAIGAVSPAAFGDAKNPAPKKVGLGFNPQPDAPAKDKSPPVTSAFQDKLDDLVFEQVVFEGASLDEVAKFLSEESAKLDRSAHEGVVVLLAGDRKQFDGIAVSLDLRRIPLSSVLRYLALVTGLNIEITRHSVVIFPPGISPSEGARLLPTLPGHGAPKFREMDLDRLNSMVFQKVEFDHTPLSSVLKFLVAEGRQMESGRPDLNILWAGKAEDCANRKVSLNLQRMPLLQAIRYAALVARVEFRVEERAVLLYPSQGGGEAGPAGNWLSEGSKTANRLNALVLRSVDFDSTPLKEGLDYLSGLVRETDPKRGPINFVLAVEPASLENLRLSFKARNATMRKVVDLIVEQTRLGVKIENDAVVFSEKAPASSASLP